MSSVLDKRTAIVELFKARNFRHDISKSLKVNRMLIWRTLKRYEEAGDIQNRPGKDRPRIPGHQDRDRHQDRDHQSPHNVLKSSKSTFC